MTDLQTIQKGWDQAAREDAMFNIITFADKKNGGWTAEEFFAHGEAEIDAAMKRLASLGLWHEGARTGKRLTSAAESAD